MGKQFSEVGNLNIYLMDFQQGLILMMLSTHIFWGPRLEILHTSQVTIYLRMYFDIFSNSPMNSLLELGGHMAHPGSCL